MNEERKAALLATKQHINFQLERFSNALNQDNIEVNVISERCAGVRGLLVQFIRIGYELNETDPNSHSIRELEDFEEKYYSLMAKAKLMIKQRTPTMSVDDDTSAVSSKIASKLKPPELPVFMGSYEKWPGWKQMFLSLVHENSRFTKILKFHYLKSSVSDKAKELIKHVQFSEENYAVAFNILSERYENKKRLESQLVKNLLNMDDICPKGNVKTLTSKQLESIYNRINQTLQSLAAANISTCCWDPIISHVVISKFDVSTLAEWERTSSDKIPPTRTQILDFLLKRQRVIESLENRTPEDVAIIDKPSARGKIDTPPSRKRPATTFGFWEKEAPAKKFFKKNKCLSCNSNSHYLSTCMIFSKFSLPDKYQFVKSNNLCKQCLKCHVGTCWSNPCRICSGPHHHMLHNSRRDDKNQLLASVSNVNDQSTENQKST